MKGSYFSLKGFSLLELTVVILIIAILTMAALSAIYSDYGYQKKCAQNLETIFKAVESYHADNYNAAKRCYEYPPDDNPTTLKSALLGPYISDANVFKCPADTSDDSYSMFYVRRNDYSALNAYLLGCPRHDKSKTALALFLQGQIMKKALSTVTRADGQAVNSGDLVSGQITFVRDGSVVNVSNGFAMLTQSFNTENNRCYSLMKAIAAYVGFFVEMECNITPGSTFEVITNQAIITVREAVRVSSDEQLNKTQFKIVATRPQDATYVGVRHGYVLVSDKDGTGKYKASDGKVIRAGMTPAGLGPYPPMDVTSETGNPIVQELINWIG